MSCRDRQIVQTVLFAAVVCAASDAAFCQQANIGVPFGQANNSFFEQSGVGFGLRGPGFFFQQNGFGQAVPPFGGFAPNAGANLGFAVNNGPNQAFFNFAFGQGARSSFTSSTPSVTIGNGGFGSFSAGEWTPFVIGAIPVVGDAPMAGGVPFGPAGTSSILEERLSRLGSQQPQQAATQSAGSPSQPAVAVDPSLDPFQRQLVVANATAHPAAMSVAGIEEHRLREREAREVAIQSEISDLVAKAEAAIEAGKPRVARIFFQQAARRAEGDLKQSLLQRIGRLESSETR